MMNFPCVRKPLTLIVPAVRKNGSTDRFSGLFLSLCNIKKAAEIQQLFSSIFCIYFLDFIIFLPQSFVLLVHQNEQRLQSIRSRLSPFLCPQNASHQLLIVGTRHI